MPGLDAFGNAIGNALGGKIQEAEQRNPKKTVSEADLQRAKQQCYIHRQRIAEGGIDGVQDQLIENGTGVMEATFAASDPQMKKQVSLIQAMRSAEVKYGTIFDDLSPGLQANILNPVLRSNGNLITTQINDWQFDLKNKAEEKISDVSKQVPPDNPRVADPVFINSTIPLIDKFVPMAANVISSTQEATGALVERIGEDKAFYTVMGFQLATAGIPRTAVNFAISKMSEVPKTFLKGALSGLIADYAFDIKEENAGLIKLGLLVPQSQILWWGRHLDQLIQ